ncbi:hypothetical protein D7Z26_13000 [Cohnella endophytica]|uniref:Uncharacterized protein n=1 Tax=Cohnella endophytica TaxID=2419778 RepID=A0A494XYY8_9BACL|nr:hypothetical protein [Cohnella endophytica]RKP54279.1 hypothetical protein D7Z26_13000 [Cohnella endophytica]
MKNRLQFLYKKDSVIMLSLLEAKNIVTATFLPGITQHAMKNIVRVLDFGGIGAFGVLLR